LSGLKDLAIANL